MELLRISAHHFCFVFIDGKRKNLQAMAKRILYQTSPNFIKWAIKNAVVRRSCGQSRERLVILTTRQIQRFSSSLKNWVIISGDKFKIKNNFITHNNHLFLIILNKKLFI